MTAHFAREKRTRLNSRTDFCVSDRGHSHTYTSNRGRGKLIYQDLAGRIFPGSIPNFERIAATSSVFSWMQSTDKLFSSTLNDMTHSGTALPESIASLSSP